jgi:hypothetical protein
MATINEILAFAQDGTVEHGDVMLLADYLADAQRTSGHQPGIARQKLMNTTLRQVTHMAAGVAQFIANRYVPGVVDDGDLAKIETGLTAAIIYIIEETPHDHFASEIVDLLTSSHIFTKGQRYAQTTLPIVAGAVTWNMEANPVAVLPMTGNVTSITMTNFKAGGTYELTTLQDASVVRSVIWPAAIRWPGGAAVELTQDVNAEDLINFSVRDDGGTPILRGYAGQDFKAVV